MLQVIKSCNDDTTFFEVIIQYTIKKVAPRDPLDI